MKQFALFALFICAIVGCTSGLLEQRPDKLRPWTTTLRDQQSDGPVFAVYRVGAARLVFIGATHENRNDSPTFRMIRDVYASFRFDTVITEGFPASWGANPTRISAYVAKSKPRSDGFVEAGETVPTVLGAQQQSARLFGGEPDDSDVKRLVLADSVNEQDLLGFYVLRNLPQWLDERKINDAADPRLQSLVTSALASQRIKLAVAVTTLPDHASWLAWYAKTNRKPLAADFQTEEVGPLVDGNFGTNAIAFAVSKARDVYLHRLMIDHLNARESVLVVFGGSHLVIHLPALRSAIGRPCYTGTDVKRAVSLCR